jgi:protein-tyrosine phosphatase
MSPGDTWSLLRSVQQLSRQGRVTIDRDSIVGSTLFNFRDLSEATHKVARHGAKLVPHKIFRSACLSRGDVDHVDIAKTLLFLTDQVRVKVIIDFRNKDERMSDPLDAVVDAIYPRVKLGAYVDPSSRRRYNISLMNKSFKIMGLFLPSKWGTKMNMVKAVVYGSEKTPTEIFAEEAMNPMGLLGLNKLMLVYGKEEIAHVLRLCANANNYPIMYHCSSGKDRTGLITALILMCCGVDAQDIIHNYAESQIFLSPVMDRIKAENQAKGLNAGFDGTPPEVMDQTIAYIYEKWGSVTGYFAYIGFGSREQMKLMQHMLSHHPDLRASREQKGPDHH